MSYEFAKKEIGDYRITIYQDEDAECPCTEWDLVGIYIKNWAKRNKLNGATDKYLSSYALLVMIIHFLQSEVHPSVLPILQKVQNETQNYTYSHTGEEFTTNLYFEEDMDKEKNYDMIVIDYPDNLIKESDSMYENGGMIYEKMDYIASAAHPQACWYKYDWIKQIGRAHV